MRKKWICLLITVTMVLVFTGCAEKTAETVPIDDETETVSVIPTPVIPISNIEEKSDTEEQIEVEKESEESVLESESEVIHNPARYDKNLEAGSDVVTEVVIRYWVFNPLFLPNAHPYYEVWEHNADGYRLRMTRYSDNGEVEHTEETIEENGAWITKYAIKSAEAPDGYEFIDSEEYVSDTPARIDYLYSIMGAAQNKTIPYERFGSLHHSDTENSYSIMDTWDRNVLDVYFNGGVCESYIETWYEETRYKREPYDVFKNLFDLSDYKKPLISTDITQNEILNEYGNLPFYQ